MLRGCRSLRAAAAPSFRPLSGASIQGPARNFSIYKSVPGDGQPDIYPAPLRTKKNGVDIINDAKWNKGVAYSRVERDTLGLRGLLPPAMFTIEDQMKAVLNNLRREPDPLKKNLLLQQLHNRNETLYHRVLVDHIEEMAPLVYTPTVGHVCQQFGRQFRRPRGMYFSRNDRGLFSSMLYNWQYDDVRVIVVTDGSRILGLGDLGVHGMGIPIGKLALYCAAGGIAPHRVLPVMLDMGTNNEDMLNDPGYLGTRERRLEGEEYFSFVDEFMQAVYRRWPKVVVQFEDFETVKAVPLLEKYRYKYRCFNDDIQGTGCVTLSGVLSACRNIGQRITDMRFVCVGAGSAGLGVCSHLVDGMVQAGLTREEAMSRFVIVTSVGALGRKGEEGGGGVGPNHERGLSEDRAPWVNDSVEDGMSLHDVVNQVKPTVLLGLSSQPKVFTEEVVRDMASHVDRPIIMPMSNPTSQCECSAQEAYEWTDGRAVVATGSPFGSVTLDDGSAFTPSQCNNMYVFPGIGLAASVAGLEHITDAMFYAAATACTESMTEEEIAAGRTFPVISRIREVSHAVACAVIREGMREGLTKRMSESDMRQESVEDIVASKMYFPDYVPLVVG